MTISFRAGEYEELYREFCDEAGIEYSTLPRNIIEEVAGEEETQDFVREWFNSDEGSFISFLRGSEASGQESEESQYDEAFDRIEAGLEYGLDDQIRAGFQALEDNGYDHTDRVKTLLLNIDSRYEQLLEE